MRPLYRARKVAAASSASSASDLRTSCGAMDGSDMTTSSEMFASRANTSRPLTYSLHVPEPLTLGTRRHPAGGDAPLRARPRKTGRAWSTATPNSTTPHSAASARSADSSPAPMRADSKTGPCFASAGDASRSSTGEPRPRVHDGVRRDPRCTSWPTQTRSLHFAGTVDSDVRRTTATVAGWPSIWKITGQWTGTRLPNYSRPATGRSPLAPASESDLEPAIRDRGAGRWSRRSL